ncbi:MAG: Mu transposase C-terminal domain-containing protein [Pseudomonadota bacterium]
MDKVWFTAAELAGLPELPSTDRRVREKAKREKWASRSRDGAKGLEYHFKSLPDKTQDALIKRALTTAPAQPPAALPPAKPSRAVAPPPKATDLKTWQRDRMVARMAILNEVRRLALGGGLGTQKAIEKVCKLAPTGELGEYLQKQARLANARRGGEEGSRTLSERTVYRWLQKMNDHGSTALAPKDQPPMDIPAWARPLLQLYCQPQKPSLQKIVTKKLPKELPAGVEPPSYDQAKRFLAKLSPITKNRGRMGPRELKALLPYVKRDTSDLLPADIYTSDGHTFKAEIAHPDHGQPFRPEVTSVFCASSRRCVGWSAALAENTWSTADALRHACETAAVPVIWYTDRGKGFINEVKGLILDRLSITHETSLPYNSQARGIIERSHQSLWVALARELPTYMGKDMDPEARKKVFKITREDIKNTGQSSLLMSWPDFLKFLAAGVEDYNNTPHSALPKMRDPYTGKVRHMTPNEAWAEGERRAREAGVELFTLTPDESRDMFRPYKANVHVHRGQVRLFGNTYFSKDLEHHHGDLVSVGYDIHDAERVWVRDADGHLLCIAEFEGNKRRHHPVSVTDMGRERRADGRRKRLQNAMDEVELERTGGRPLIEAQPLSDIDQALAQQQFDELMGRLTHEPAPAEVTSAQFAELTNDAPSRPLFASDSEKYLWLERHADQVSDDDDAWLEWYRNTNEFQLMFG